MITPDGPRGPAYSVQKGAIWLARSTGARVVPVSLNMRSPWRLKGWDRTQVPKPFSRGELVIGAPLTFQPDAETGSVEQALLEALQSVSGAPSEA